MGQILSSGCGSYTDLDSVTASADDVLEKKIIIDKDGDPVVGTMKNIGAYDTAVSVAANSTDLYTYYQYNFWVSRNFLYKRLCT